MTPGVGRGDSNTGVGVASGDSSTWVGVEVGSGVGSGASHSTVHGGKGVMDGVGGTSTVGISVAGMGTSVAWPEGRVGSEVGGDAVGSAGGISVTGMETSVAWPGLGSGGGGFGNPPSPLLAALRCSETDRLGAALGGWTDVSDVSDVSEGASALTTEGVSGSGVGIATIASCRGGGGVATASARFSGFPCTTSISRLIAGALSSNNAPPKIIALLVFDVMIPQLTRSH